MREGDSILMRDRRAIKSIWFDSDRHIAVGQGLPPVQSIRPYEDKGPMDYVVWLEVWRDGRVTDRIPSWKVHIRYD